MNACETPRASRGFPVAMKRTTEIAVLCAVLLGCLGLLAQWLDQPLFRVDEAESTINALTILDRGYPADHYLGLPIFENTLTQRWPESPEYEFRDSSYSSRGFAIYHGWLPLYAIAASLKLFGIEPDRPGEPLAVRRSPEEIARLTVAARAPGVLFGMLFLLLVFGMAHELYGRAVAWSALLVGALYPATFGFTRQARYYALTMLLSTACCLFVWRVSRHGRWRDYLLAGILFSLLFHTHVIAFVTACGVMALVLLPAVRRPGILPRATVFSGIVLAATLPWAWVTGFLEQAGRIPMAWPNLRLPDDLLAFVRLPRPTSLLLFGGILAFLVVDLFGSWLPPGFARPLRARRAEFRLLLAWMVLAWLTLTTLTPAASYSLKRLALPMLGPGLILAASLVVALARTALPRVPIGVAALLLPAYLAVFGSVLQPVFKSVQPQALDTAPAPEGQSPQGQEIIDFLRTYRFKPGTRIFASPNVHLLLTVYTGLPIQSIAPMRKSFLDSYPGDILLIEIGPFRSPLGTSVQDTARMAGVEIGTAEARELAWLVTSRAMRERLHGSVAELDPSLQVDGVPPFLRSMIGAQQLDTEEWLRRGEAVTAFPAMFRGFRIPDWTTWWGVYFYRFVGPDARMGPNANYADRIRHARASVSRFSGKRHMGLIVYESPPPPAGPPADVTSGSP
jgi:Dolichyl-phosphate-mannose-protein mannosyltransferase